MNVTILHFTLIAEVCSTAALQVVTAMCQLNHVPVRVLIQPQLIQQRTYYNNMHTVQLTMLVIHVLPKNGTQ